LREGYAGGIVNVHKPRLKSSLKRKEMYCYDVNSLYPFIMQQEFAPSLKTTPPLRIGTPLFPSP